MAEGTGLLLNVADAALRRPDDTVRQVVYPVLGEDNLRNLAAAVRPSLEGRYLKFLRSGDNLRQPARGPSRRRREEPGTGD